MKALVLGPDQQAFDTRYDALLAARRCEYDVDVVEACGRWVVSRSATNKDGLSLPPRLCKRCVSVRYDCVFGVCQRCRRRAKGQR